ATNPTGDYEFCLHGHELQPGGSVEVTVGNVTETGEKDILRRMTLIDVVVPANSTGEEGNMETFSSQVAVVGRLWQPIGGTEGLEGIPVEGVSPVGKQVTMVLTLANGTELTETATTNNYGDFVAIFDTDVDVTGATMTFQTQSAGETIEDTVDVDPGLRAVYHKFIIDKELETNNSPAFGVLAGMLGLVLAVGLVATYRHHRR
ncbi:MAG: hypothetical protein R3185_08030, partial [Candidatus Thermoplasmatota archaeon]|nr:hypothetical protein [Candidatus Thermoplasmatota archaeon]